MLQMASHNRFKQPLARDALIVVILTLAILILSGIIGVSTVSLINSFGYEYTASSFGKSPILVQKYTGENDGILYYMTSNDS